MQSEFRLFIGNVPFNTTVEEFNNFFKQCEGFKESKLVTKSESNLSRGFGFVTFDTKENADKLLTQGLIFGNQTLRVSSFVEKKRQYSAYIRNIGKDVTESNLKEALKCQSVAMRTNKFGGAYAVAYFDSLDDYKNAKENLITIGENQYKALPYVRTSRRDNIQGNLTTAAYQTGFANGYKNALLEAKTLGLANVPRNNDIRDVQYGAKTLGLLPQPSPFPPTQGNTRRSRF